MGIGNLDKMKKKMDNIVMMQKAIRTADANNDKYIDFDELRQHFKG